MKRPLVDDGKSGAARRARLCSAACLLAGFVLLALVSGCSRAPDDSRRTVKVAGDFSTPVQVRINNFVRRQPPAIYVAPQQSLDRRPSGLFVPLRAVQQIANPVSFSDMLSRQVWQVWLSLNAFHTLLVSEQWPIAHRAAIDDC